MTKQSFSLKVAARLLAAALLISKVGTTLAQEATLPPPTPEPAAASATPAPFATVAPVAPWVSPTPDSTGAITVVVQPNESLWSIAARAGLTLPDLLFLNGLTENDVIRPGDVVIIGYGTPNAGFLTVEEQTPTATLPPPTLRPTQPRPSAAICISAFDDSDEDRVRDTGEPLRGGVAFTIFNDTVVVANYITDGLTEPKCIEGLAPGRYSVTRSISPGEMLTTDGNWALTLTADSMLQQDFGSVMSGQAVVPGTLVSPQPGASQAGTPTPPMLGSGGDAGTSGDGSPPVRSLAVALAVGGGLLLVAAVLIYLLRQARRAS